MPGSGSLRRIVARVGVGIGVIGLWAARPVALKAQAPPPSAPPAAEDRTFTLTPHFVKGQTLRYLTASSMIMRFASEGGRAPIMASAGLDKTLRYTALDVRPDGSATLSMLSDGGKEVDANDTAQELPKEPDSVGRTVTFDKHSHFVALKDPTRRGSAGLLSDPTDLFPHLHFLPLPDHPIKVGESWSARYPLPNMPADSGDAGSGEDMSAIRVNMTLLGTENVRNQETLKVKQEVFVPFAMPIDAHGGAADRNHAKGRVIALLTFTQTVNLLPDDGRMVRSQGNIGGWLKFEGTLDPNIPKSATIGGTLIAALTPNESPAAPDKK